MTEITEQQKLVWLGLRQPTNQSNDAGQIVPKLQAAFGDDYADFRDAFDAADLSDFDGFEAFLTDNEVEDAGAIRRDFDRRYDGNFASFSDDILSFDSYIELSSAFGTSNELRSDITDDDGNPAAGIRFYESGGIGREGQNIPVAGVEVYGREIHFSQTGETADAPSPVDGSGVFNYADLEVSPTTTPAAGETIFVSATVTNPSSSYRTETVQFYEDDRVYNSRTIGLGAGASTVVEFEWRSLDIGSYRLTIGDLPTRTITNVHPSL